MSLAKVKPTDECQKPVETLMKYWSLTFLWPFDWETFSNIYTYVLWLCVCPIDAFYARLRSQKEYIGLEYVIYWTYKS